MSINKEIINKAIVIKDLKQNPQNTTKIIEDYEKEKRFFGKLKRKYRLMLTFIFFFSIILTFMILPMVIGAIAQGLWG